MQSEPRVALVHDWLTGMRGGEKVLEHFADLFPKAPIYTLLHVPGSISPRLESHPIRTSALQHMPRATKDYRYYLPLMPAFVEAMKIEPVDLVISTSSCVAKSVRIPAGATHACYMFSPMRYLYDQYDEYFAPNRSGLMTRTAMRLVRRPLQWWDKATARRVNSLVGISTFVAERILRVYDRMVPVIAPPVETARFAAARREPDDYYLMVTALVPYKRVDLAIEAFRGTDRRLVVAGSGPMYERLKATCPPNVELKGWVDDEEIVDLVAGCRAFIFPQVEDFGIAPVEAMAAGRPVIALGEGGALDTIRDVERWQTGELDGSLGPTGIFFAGNRPSDLREALEDFERQESLFHSPDICAWATNFDQASFRSAVIDWFSALLPSQASPQLPRVSA